MYGLNNHPDLNRSCLLALGRVLIWVGCRILGGIRSTEYRDHSSTELEKLTPLHSKPPWLDQTVYIWERKFPLSKIVHSPWKEGKTRFEGDKAYNKGREGVGFRVSSKWQHVIHEQPHNKKVEIQIPIIRKLEILVLEGLTDPIFEWQLKNWDTIPEQMFPIQILDMSGIRIAHCLKSGSC